MVSLPSSRYDNVPFMDYVEKRRFNSTFINKQKVNGQVTLLIDAG